jgi:putative transposase
MRCLGLHDGHEPSAIATALKMALWRRDHTDRRVDAGLIHHSDGVSQPC